jgi:hypothetical protein
MVITECHRVPVMAPVMAPRAALMAARAAVTPRAVARAVGALLVCMALKVLAEEPSILKLSQGKGPVVILRMMMLCSIDFTSQYEREKARGFSHTHLPDPRSHTRVLFFSIVVLNSFDSVFQAPEGGACKTT